MRVHRMSGLKRDRPIKQSIEAVHVIPWKNWNTMQDAQQQTPTSPIPVVEPCFSVVWGRGKISGQLLSHRVTTKTKNNKQSTCSRQETADIRSMSNTWSFVRLIDWLIDYSTTMCTVYHCRLDGLVQRVQIHVKNWFLSRTRGDVHISLHNVRVGRRWHGECDIVSHSLLWLSQGDASWQAETTNPSPVRQKLSSYRKITKTCSVIEGHTKKNIWKTPIIIFPNTTRVTSATVWGCGNLPCRLWHKSVQSINRSRPFTLQIKPTQQSINQSIKRPLEGGMYFDHAKISERANYSRWPLSEIYSGHPGKFTLLIIQDYPPTTAGSILTKDWALRCSANQPTNQSINRPKDVPQQIHKTRNIILPLTKNFCNDKFAS